MEAYLFKDVLFALREEYLKNKRLLEELKRYVIVLDKNTYRYDFYLAQYSHLKKPELMIELEKNQAKIEKLIRMIICKPNNSFILFNNNNEAFLDAKLNLVINNTLPYDETKRFYEEVKEILNNSFSLNIYSMFMNFNDECDLFNRLNTTQEGIEFLWYTNTSTVPKKCLYETKKDILSFSSSFINSSFIQTIFNKEIPKSILPEFHQAIIEQYDKDRKIKIYDDGTSKEFSIIDDNKNIILKRK